LIIQEIPIGCNIVNKFNPYEILEVNTQGSGIEYIIEKKAGAQAIYFWEITAVLSQKK